MKTDKSLIIILLAAFVLRLVWVILAPGFDPVLKANIYHGDAAGYHVLAVNLIQRGILSFDGQNPTSYRMPGYPAFVGVHYAIAGLILWTIRLSQALLGALTCLPVYLFAKRLSGKRTAILASLGIALHPLLVYMTSWLYAETLFIFLLWMGIWLLGESLASSSTKTAALTGIVLGLATLVKPEIFAFPAAVLLWGALMRWSKTQMRLTLVTQVMLLLVLAPWAIRNTLVNSAFTPLTTSSGANFYAGNNPQAQGGSAWIAPMPGLSEVESDRALKGQAWEWINENPGNALAALPKKLLNFYSPVTFEIKRVSVGKWTWLINLLYTGFLVLAGWGAWRNVRKTPAVILLALISWYTLLVLIFYGGSRLALPISPALMIFAAFSIDQIFRSSGGQSTGKAVANG